MPLKQEQKQFTCEDGRVFLFTCQQLGPIRTCKLARRVGVVAGSLFTDLQTILKANKELTPDVLKTLGTLVSDVCSRMTDADIDFLLAECAASLGLHNDSNIPVSCIGKFDMIFAGELAIMFQVVAWSLGVILGGFFPKGLKTDSATKAAT